MAGNSGQATATEDDEWEYEYDEKETEDFYVTLDLTTHVSPAARRQFPDRPKPDLESQQSKNSRKRRHGRGRARRKEAEDFLRNRRTSDAAEDVDNPDDEAAEDEDVEVEVEEDAEDEEPQPRRKRPARPRETNPHNAQISVSDKHIQILELHSDNPIIAVDKRAFSCHWASSVGTDMLFEAPANRDLSPPRPGKQDNTNAEDAKLVALTRSRLVAKPVNLTVKSNEDMSERVPVVHAAQVEMITPSVKPTRARGPKKHHITQSRQDQKSFLERLSTARRNKGEDPWVPWNVHELNLPEEERPRRAAMLEANDQVAPQQGDSVGEESDIDTSGGWRRYAGALADLTVSRGQDGAGHGEGSSCKRRRGFRGATQHAAQQFTDGERVNVERDRGVDTQPSVPYTRQRLRTDEEQNETGQFTETIDEEADERIDENGAVEPSNDRLDSTPTVEESVQAGQDEIDNTVEVDMVDM